MVMAVIAFWKSHAAELAGLMAQHVLIVAISTMAAVAIGVPLGVFASRRPRLSAPIVGIVNIVQTVPSLAGAIPAALLALSVDAGLLWVERQLSTRRRTRSRRAAVSLAAAAVAAVLLSSGLVAGRSGGAIVVGSKNFTEQMILGEIIAETIERDTGLTVKRRLNLGGTLICDRALMTGDIDVYVEYTGTALTAIFHQPITPDARASDSLEPAPPGVGPRRLEGGGAP